MIALRSLQKTAMSDENRDMLLRALIFGSLIGGGTLLSTTPKGKAKKDKKQISLPIAAGTGLLFPSGPIIHGALADRRNQTGMMNDAYAAIDGNPTKTPSGMYNMLLGSLGGMLGGGAIGGGLGLAANKLTGTEGMNNPAMGGALGALAGMSGGAVLGARHYNKKLSEDPKKEKV